MVKVCFRDSDMMVAMESLREKSRDLLTTAVRKSERENSSINDDSEYNYSQSIGFAAKKFEDAYKKMRRAKKEEVCFDI